MLHHLHLVKSREKNPTTFPSNSTTKLNLGVRLAGFASSCPYMDIGPPGGPLCLLFNSPRMVNTWQVILPIIHALSFQVINHQHLNCSSPEKAPGWPSQYRPNLPKWLFCTTPSPTFFGNECQVYSDQNASQLDRTVECSVASLRSVISCNGCPKILSIDSIDSNLILRFLHTPCQPVLRSSSSDFLVKILHSLLYKVWAGQ